MNTLKVFSTFTGIGSPEMALRNIGVDFEVVGISDVDKYALLAYDRIHSEKSEMRGNDLIFVVSTESND